MAHDVFISHSAKDKTCADAVCAMLEANGVRCWIAPRDVTPAMEWGKCIIDAIEECRIMVLVFTAHSNDSPQVRREVERAVNHGVAILPLRLEEVTPDRGLEFFIGNVHWLDALTPPLETHLTSLAGTVKMLLARIGPRDAVQSAVAAQLTATAPARTEVAGPGPPVIAKAGSSEDHAKQPSVAPTAKPAAEAVHAPSIPSPRLTPPTLSGTFTERAKGPVAGRKWLRLVLGGASVLIVSLAVFYLLASSSDRHDMRNSNRLELALVADDTTKQAGTPLHTYGEANKTYVIERDITFPGDIERIWVGTDTNGRPDLGIHLASAAVDRINSGAGVLGRQIALVLDGRTVLEVATVQTSIGDESIFTGNFSSDDITRMVDAISRAPSGNQ